MENGYIDSNRGDMNKVRSYKFCQVSDRFVRLGLNGLFCKVYNKKLGLIYIDIEAKLYF